MITLYNENGDFCLCNPDQVDSMKSIGYTLEKNPLSIKSYTFSSKASLVIPIEEIISS